MSSKSYPAAGQTHLLLSFGMCKQSGKFFSIFFIQCQKGIPSIEMCFQNSRRHHECLRLLFTIGFLVDLSFSAVGMQFFFFLIEFWFAALFASHSSLEISTCGIKSDKPQNKLFQRKSISCEEKKNPTPQNLKQITDEIFQSIFQAFQVIIGHAHQTF